MIYTYSILTFIYIIDGSINTTRSKVNASKEKDGKWSKQILTHSSTTTSHTNTVENTTKTDLNKSNTTITSMIQPSALLTRPTTTTSSTSIHNHKEELSKTTLLIGVKELQEELQQDYDDSHRRTRNTDSNIVPSRTLDYKNERNELRRKERESRGPRTKGLLYRYNEGNYYYYYY